MERNETPARAAASSKPAAPGGLGETAGNGGAIGAEGPGEPGRTPGPDNAGGGYGPGRQGKPAPARGEVAVTGVFLAFILAVGVLERMFPLDFIVPGARLGFSNVVVLVSIYLFRFRTSLILVFLKCLITSMLVGGPSALAYSLSGSLLSFFVMYLLVKAAGERVSAVGVSVAGAAAHSTGQIMAASLVLDNFGMFAYLPALLALGTVSGVLVGVIVKSAVPRLRPHTPGHG